MNRLSRVCEVLFRRHNFTNIQLLIWKQPPPPRPLCTPLLPPPTPFLTPPPTRQPHHNQLVDTSGGQEGGGLVKGSVHIILIFTRKINLFMEYHGMWQEYLFENSQTISILCIFLCFYFPVSLFFPLFLFGIWLMFYDIFLFIVISVFFLCVVSLVYLADYSTPWDPLPLLSFTPYYSPFSPPPPSPPKTLVYIRSV